MFVKLVLAATTGLAAAAQITPAAHADTLDTKADLDKPFVDPTGPNGTICQLLPPLCTTQQTPSGLPGPKAHTWGDLLAVQP